MNKSFNEEGVQFAWDSTSLKLAEECLYKYKLRMIDGWRPQGISVHLFFGGVYAKALENFHKFRAQGWSFDQALNRVIHNALIATWIYETCDTCEGTGRGMVMKCYGGLPCEEEDNCPDCQGRGQYGGHPWLSDHNTKTRENLIRTIVWYTEQYRDDPCKTVILSSGQAAVEHSFRIEIDTDLIYAGHLDRLVDYGDKLYIQDQKTTGTTISPRFFTQYQLDSQMFGYTFAGKAIFNLPVKGVMIDGAQIAVGFSRFERGFSFYDEARLDEWLNASLYNIYRAQQAVRENRFPQNFSSCNKYAGCEFRNICSVSPHVRENFLKADFEKLPTWDPLEVR